MTAAWRRSFASMTAKDSREYTTRVLLYSSRLASQPTAVLECAFRVGKNLDMDLIKALAKEVSDNYPERLAFACVYPTGMVLRGIWKVVQWCVVVDSAAAASRIFRLLTTLMNTQVL